MSAQGMPPNLLALFAPRPPIEFLSQISHKKRASYEPVSECANLFGTEAPPTREPFETPKRRRARIKQEKLVAHQAEQEQKIKEYDPNALAEANSQRVTRDPFATLFVSRMSFETTEKKLKREFEAYGPIRRIFMITDHAGKSRGYAFIEYESERDMKEAYKHAESKRLDGRRLLVDVERARTVPQWLPRRLGGGRGPARYTAPKPKNAPVF
eukprot:Polyplicarium_translucidae@DN1734_c0_g2_i1.p1